MKSNIIIAFIFGCNLLSAQNFTRKDSLQGGFSLERMCFDVQHYDLDIKVDPEKQFISGSNTISFKMHQESSTIQLDLFENMKVDSILFENKKLAFKREFGAVFVSFPSPLKVTDNILKLQFFYSGNPIIAKNAPWDGGFVFSKDANNKPWIGVAVQGTGASLWYPVKDSQSDEPDRGALIKVAVPNGLMNVSNGRFKGNLDLKNGYTRWDWEVKNPINTYSITLNIGDYVHIHEKHNDVDLDYYVLRDNKEKTSIHFAEVKPMMDCFESKFGSYPFIEDGYKLIESNYLGMEHQSAVSYGNKYRKGYAGRDNSGTGIGMKFDFIIIHESAHEWFGNSITSRDIADMWIHEAFTTYAESVYIECQWGKKKAIEYINGQMKLVQNSSPVIGNYELNNKGSVDMYYKGTLILNTLRNSIDDDEKWWTILKKFAQTNRHKIVETEEVIAFFSSETGWNLKPFFNQYLKHTSLPVLETKRVGTNFSYRWNTDVIDFELPVYFLSEGKKIKIQPTNQWNTIKIKANAKLNFPNELFYVKF
ncbi:M1 family metallopeptidase [Flavobacterium sp.]|uniref:M1 family metallopeptidase n=1 Tax=Flavobacterium sp. TaxID=239 RepID=UPI002605BBEE|nr:M1 family metallopeptidase [Flavobacterium sp.]MDD3005249.1 M1 family metallopeptidase [Flavobacterium sp.]